MFHFLTDCLRSFHDKSVCCSCSKEKLASAYNERGFTKYLFVDFDGAIDDYTKAIELKELAVYYYNRGLVHYRLG